MSDVKWVGVLPIIYHPYGEVCVGSMAPEFRKRVLRIDNHRYTNLGVAGSWNRGVDYMEEEEADWLVIISAAVRFGPPGGMDFIDQIGRIEKFRFYPAVEGGDGLGWHLIAFHRDVFERVGVFDENFYPAYCEDLDFSWRIQCGFGLTTVRPVWPKVPVDASHVQNAHGIKLGGVKVDHVAMQAYLQRKWNWDQGDEGRWRAPWNSLGLKDWPEPLR